MLKRLVALVGAVVLGLSLVWSAGPALAAHSAAPAADGGDTATPGLEPVTPARLLDTRTSGGMVKAGGTRTVQAAGRGGVPATGVAAVVVNLTVTGPTAPGYLTAYPSGTTRPGASNVNYVKGQTVANQAIIKVDESGSFTLYSGAATHALVDVTGYFPTGAAYTPLSPSRVLDTRHGVGAPTGLVRAGGVVRLKVTGAGGVPESGAGAVVLNVTDTGAQGPGYVTVYPDGSPRPGTSTLNYTKGQTTAGMTIAKVGDGGYVDLYTGAASHLVADVAGWFPTTSDYTPVTPVRALDTRNGTGRGGVKGQLGAGRTVELQVAGRYGLPEIDDDPAPTAVEVTVTATGPSANGYLTGFPSDVSRPGVSTLNYLRGQTVANSATVGVGGDGKISVYTPAATHVIVDVVGYFSAANDTTTPPGTTYPTVQTITSGNAYHGQPSLNGDGSLVLFSQESDDSFYEGVAGGRTAQRTTPAQEADQDQQSAQAAGRALRAQTDDEADEGGLRLYDAGTGTTTTVVKDAELPDYGVVGDYQLSTDGSTVLYSYDTYDYDEATDTGTDTWTLNRLDRTTGQTTKVATYTSSDDSFYGGTFDASPDNRFVAYDQPTGQVWGDPDFDEGVPVTKVMLKDLSGTAAASQVNEAGVSASVSSVAADGSVAYGAFTKAQVDHYAAGTSTVWRKGDGKRASIPRSSSDSDVQLNQDSGSAVFQDQNDPDGVYVLDSWTRSGNAVSKLTSESDLEEYGGEQSADGRYVVHDVDYYRSTEDDEDYHPVGVRLWDTTAKRLITVAGADSYTVGQDDAAIPTGGTVSADGSHVAMLTGHGQVALWGPNPRDPNARRALELVEADLPVGVVGSAYSGTLQARGGKAPYTWSAQGLPDGLGLDASTGTVTGTPTAASDDTVAVTVTDSRGSTVDGPVTLTVVAPLGRATSVSGSGYSCSTLQSGGVGCWNGGDSPSTGRAPTAVTGLPDGATVTKVVAGDYAGCAVLSSKQLWCWSGYDQQASRDVSLSAAPVTDAIADSPDGDGAYCALLVPSTGPVVRCTSYDDETDAKPRTLKFGGTVTALSGGNGYVCGLLSTGYVQCTYPDSGEPPATVAGVGARSISAGTDGGCAVVTGATVRCWDGFDEGSSYAISGVTGVTQVATDGDHGCARTSAGTVSCWGGNYAGELGNGSTTTPASRTTAYRVSGLAGVSGVAAGSSRSCAVLTDGSARCWGAPDTGDGSEVLATRPVKVLALG